MKHTTIQLPDDLDARLWDLAQRRHATTAEIAREAIEAYVGPHVPKGPRRLRAAASGRSGRSHISMRVEELLVAGDPDPR
jgi:hypothetical protein